MTGRFGDWPGNVASDAPATHVIQHTPACPWAWGTEAVGRRALAAFCDTHADRLLAVYFKPDADCIPTKARIYPAKRT